MKTAALLAGALKIGALVANASDEDAEHAYQFGRKVGLAFQLQDDLLDSFGDPAKFGKKVGGDIVQNKKTYLVLRSLELADKSTQERLLELLADQTMLEVEKVESVKLVFKQLNIPEETSLLKNKYQEEALVHLNQIKVDDHKKSKLRDLANEMLGREI